MFKEYKFRIFQYNPNDPNFDLYKFLGDITLHISTLREENAANKANNKVINKTVVDFQKNNCSEKIKRIKMIYQKRFTKL